MKKKTPEALDFSEINLPKINEFQFKTRFLRRFLDRDPEVQLEARTDWLTEVAIHPLVRVEVVSDDNHDEVLFWVPQTMYSPDTHTTNEIGNIVSEVMNMEKNLSKEIAENVLRRNLPAGKTFAAAPPPEEDTAQWKSILAKYGLCEGDPEPGKKTDRRSVDHEDIDEYEW